MKILAILFVNLLGIYFLIGILSTIFLRLKVLQKIDTGLEGTSFWFKLLIFPGRVAFWPALLAKYIKANRHDQTT